MGSITTTLNSVDSYLMNEIDGANSTTPTDSSTSGSSTAAGAIGTSSSDSVNFSQAGQLFQQLQELQTTDPTGFKQVTANAASQLQQAAQQATDPSQASFLSNFAAKFQQASQVGNLSPFEGADPSSTASGHHGHHHHHGGGLSTQDGSSIQDVLVTLLSGAQASGSAPNSSASSGS
jgi:hypothetical protein